MQISIVDRLSSVLNLFMFFQLRIQERSQYLGRQVTGADIDPAVFVYLSSEKPGAVGTFFSNDFCTLNQLGIVDQKSTTFTAVKVFGFVKTLRSQCTKGTEETSLIFSKQPMRIVFNDREVVLTADSLNRIHRATDATIVNWYHSFSAFGN